VGDTLGTTLEFKRPGTFSPIIDMVGGGPFGLTPGQWTDDTSMALCLAIIRCCFVILIHNIHNSPFPSWRSRRAER
jgi:ADP-ribosylglycohydrolase